MNIMAPSAEELINKATFYIDNGQFDHAAAACIKALSRYPNHEVVERIIVSLQIIDDRTYDFPTSFRALNQLYSAGELHLALLRAKHVASHFPNQALIFHFLGRLYSELEQSEKALANYKRALEIKSDYAEVYNDLGLYYHLLGYKSEAITNLEKALLYKPNNATTYRNLSTIKHFNESDPQIALMGNFLNQPSCTDSDRMHLHFALGKVFEDIKEFPVAFSHFQRGNELRKRLKGYDFSAESEKFVRIMAIFSRVGPEIFIKPEKLNARPIFILGMPRSGSSLVEQILSSHSKISGAGELKLLGNAISSLKLRGMRLCADDVSLLRANYLDQLSKFDFETPFFCDKMPSNFLWLGFIRAALPEAKIIHIVRDARATSWSNFKHYFASSGNDYAYNLNDIVSYYRLYKQLMCFWEDKFPGQFYQLDYEKLVESQEDETRRLLQYVGVDYEETCLEFHKSKRMVSTASASQVRKKIYRGSSKKWQDYEEFLQPYMKSL